MDVEGGNKNNQQMTDGGDIVPVNGSTNTHDSNIRNRKPSTPPTAMVDELPTNHHHHKHHKSTNNQIVNNIIPAATKAPKETLQAIYSAGKYKANLRLNVLIVQSWMAGVYIAAAGQLYLTVGGGVLGAVLFPGGLIAVILTSAELFTGDALIFVASVLGGQVKIKSLLRNWSVSWISNFVGCVCWAYVMAYLSNALVDSGAQELTIKVAEKKAQNAMYSIFIKGIGANFMVCVAVWQGTCAQEVAGKILALWFPTASFVMLGFDHVVANMFILPIGMMLGANISVGRMFAALFMATLGNVVGGGIFVGAVYWYVFDSMSQVQISRLRESVKRLSGVIKRISMEKDIEEDTTDKGPIRI